MGASQSKQGGGWCPQKRKNDTASGDDDLEAGDEDRGYDSQAETEGGDDEPGKKRSLDPDDPDYDPDAEGEDEDAQTAVDEEEDNTVDLEDPENPGRDEEEEEADDSKSLNDKARAKKERRPLKADLKRVDRDFDRAQRKGRIFPQLWVDRTIPNHDELFDKIINNFRCQDWENALAENAGPEDPKFPVPNPGRIPHLRAIITFKHKLKQPKEVPEEPEEAPEEFEDAHEEHFEEAPESPHSDAEPHDEEPLDREQSLSPHDDGEPHDDEPHDHGPHDDEQLDRPETNSPLSPHGDGEPHDEEPPDDEPRDEEPFPDDEAPPSPKPKEPERKPTGPLKDKKGAIVITDRYEVIIITASDDETESEKFLEMNFPRDHAGVPPEKHKTPLERDYKPHIRVPHNHKGCDRIPQDHLPKYFYDLKVKQAEQQRIMAEAKAKREAEEARTRELMECLAEEEQEGEQRPHLTYSLIESTENALKKQGLATLQYFHTAWMQNPWAVPEPPEEGEEEPPTPVVPNVPWEDFEVDDYYAVIYGPDVNKPNGSIQKDGRIKYKLGMLVYRAMSKPHEQHERKEEFEFLVPPDSNDPDARGELLFQTGHHIHRGLKKGDVEGNKAFNVERAAAKRHADEEFKQTHPEPAPEGEGEGEDGEPGEGPEGEGPDGPGGMSGCEDGPPGDSPGGMGDGPGSPGEASPPPSPPPTKKPRGPPKGKGPPSPSERGRHPDRAGPRGPKLDGMPKGRRGGPPVPDSPFSPTSPSGDMSPPPMRGPPPRGGGGAPRRGPPPPTVESGDDEDMMSPPPRGGPRGGGPPRGGPPPGMSDDEGPPPPRGGGGGGGPPRGGKGGPPKGRGGSMSGDEDLDMPKGLGGKGKKAPGLDDDMLLDKHGKGGKKGKDGKEPKEGKEGKKRRGSDEDPLFSPSDPKKKGKKHGLPGLDDDLLDPLGKAGGKKHKPGPGEKDDFKNPGAGAGKRKDKAQALDGRDPFMDDDMDPFDPKAKHRRGERPGRPPGDGPRKGDGRPLRGGDPLDRPPRDGPPRDRDRPPREPGAKDPRGPPRERPEGRGPERRGGEPPRGGGGGRDWEREMMMRERGGRPPGGPPGGRGPHDRGRSRDPGMEGLERSMSRGQGTRERM